MQIFSQTFSPEQCCDPGYYKGEVRNAIRLDKLRTRRGENQVNSIAFAKTKTMTMKLVTIIFIVILLLFLNSLFHCTDIKNLENDLL